MSNPQGVYAASRKGRTLDEIYGVGLGSETGPFAWPYAACSGKLASTGTFLPHHPREAVRLCKVYCNRKRQLTGGSEPDREFESISRFPQTTTCEQQCEEIATTYEKRQTALTEIKEGFSIAEANEQPWYLIPFAFFITALSCLLIMHHRLPYLESPLPIVNVF